MAGPVSTSGVSRKSYFLGSTHLHYGCEAAAYGWDFAKPVLDWARLIENKNIEIKRLNDIYRNLLNTAGVTLYEARATLIDAHTLNVGGKNITADKILIATGGRPSRGDIPGNEHAVVSDDAFYLKDLPKNVLVVGGGYIAVEFAGIFNGYGADTTLVPSAEIKFLRGFLISMCAPILPPKWRRRA